MTSTLWNISTAAIQSLNDIPSWLKEQACLNFQGIIRLPTLDVAVDGDDVLPDVEEKLVKSDYLDFLREQIELEARGPEWGRILKARLAALEPLVDKIVITAMFFRKPDSVTLRINPETSKVIQVEVI